ncbi:MAG: phosphodiesterase [Janthinobacterium lividum]
MTDLTTLIQITDLHIKRPGALAYGEVDSAAFLRRAIARLNTLSPRPDAVVITGDLVDSGNLDEYLHLASLLDVLELPCHLLVGNHDARESLRQVFGEVAGGGDFIQYSVDIGALRLIALDSLDAGCSGGTLCAARLAWLAEALEDARERPVIVALHHPPFRTGIGHMDRALLDERSSAALAALIARYPNVERLIAGHLHREIHRRFAGTLASTAGSVAHQVCLDLRPDAPSAFTMEPPTYVVHRWSADGGLVSHLGYVDTYAGPFPFHDDRGVLLD